ncbi:hypothetical protein D3C71_2001070 [compost metagenome]
MSLMGSGYAANAAGTGGGMGTSIPDTGANGMRTERIRETNGTGTHMLNGTGHRFCPAPAGWQNGLMGYIP